MTKQKGKTKRSRQLAYRVEPGLVQQLDNLVIDTMAKDRYITTRSEIINMMLKEGLEARGYSVDAQDDPERALTRPCGCVNQPHHEQQTQQFQADHLHSIPDGPFDRSGRLCRRRASARRHRSE